ncbi:hypothetical protein D3C84_519180 [compost metagenome]
MHMRLAMDDQTLGLPESCVRLRWSGLCVHKIPVPSARAPAFPVFQPYRACLVQPYKRFRFGSAPLNAPTITAYKLFRSPELGDTNALARTGVHEIPVPPGTFAFSSARGVSALCGAAPPAWCSRTRNSGLVGAPTQRTDHHRVQNFPVTRVGQHQCLGTYRGTRISGADGASSLPWPSRTRNSGLPK